MALKADTTHVVIEFCGETRNKQLLVDLVVGSWVFYSQTSARWICKYPQDNDYIHLLKWVRECVPPREDFPEFEVRIIKEASSFEIAVSYLQESYTTSEIKSINGDVEDNLSDPENPRIFSEKETANILAKAKNNVSKTSNSADGGSKSQVSVAVTQPAERSISQQRNEEIVSSPSTSSEKSSAQKKTKTALMMDHQSLTGSDGNLDDSTKTVGSSASSEDEQNMPRSVKQKATTEKTRPTKSQASAERINAVESSTSSEDEQDLSRNVKHKGRRGNSKTAESQTSAESLNTVGSIASLEDEQYMARNVRRKGTTDEMKTATSTTSAGTSEANKKNCSSTRETPPPRRHKSPPVVASLKDLTDMEARLEKKIKASKRSILYNMTKIYRVVKANAVVRNGQAEVEPVPPENVLGMNFPLERAEQFETLEAQLEDPDAKAAMRTYMLLFSCGNTPQEDIANILPEIIKKNIQLLYSGAGKVQKGISKLNFSATATYSCMEEILMRKYANKIKPKQIRSHTGTWLSRAGDREGGKAERDAKTAAEKAERAAAIKAADDAMAAEAAVEKAARDAATKAANHAKAVKAAIAAEAAAKKAERDAATKTANHAKAAKVAKAAKAAKVAKADKDG